VAQHPFGLGLMSEHFTQTVLRQMQLQAPQSISVPQLLAIWPQLFGPHGSLGVQHDPVPFWQICPAAQQTS
jgi:hypothetical protein